MNEKNDSTIGKVRIATEVLTAYISNATLSTDGVAGFSGNLGDAISQTIRGKQSPSKGIKITEGEKGYTIDLYVILAYGTRIPDVAWNIQKSVKLRLEDVMAIDIEGVNIHVQEVVGAEGDVQNEE